MLQVVRRIGYLRHMNTSLLPCCYEVQRFMTSDKHWDNPIDYLNQYSKVPLMSESQYVYTPTQEQVVHAQKYFKPNDRDFKPWKGKASVDRLPESVTPEVAFLGRSNVGKSSLISELFFNRTYKIKISKTPGRTRAIHVYQLGDHFSLVDMPGYGENMPQYFVDCVEMYLIDRKNLARSFLLIDMCTGISDVDKIGLGMMEDAAIPYAIVLTKLDQCSASEQLRAVHTVVQYIDRNLTACLPQPFIVSAHNGQGINFLRAFIAHVTHCAQQDRRECAPNT